MAGKPALQGVASVRKQVTVALAAILAVMLACGVGLGVYYSIGTTGAGRGGSPVSLGRFDSGAAMVRAYKSGLEPQTRMSKDGAVYNLLSPATGAASEESAEHSTTNVQVEGVDEADIVKNDGRYVYAVSGNSVFIVAAWPPEAAGVASRIDLPAKSSPGELFVSGDRLVVIGTSCHEAPGGGAESASVLPRGGLTFAHVYDITDRSAPRKIREIEYEGDYSTSRMIKGDVHVVCTTYPYRILYDENNPSAEDLIPKYRDTAGGASPGLFRAAAGYGDVQVVDPGHFTSFLSVVSFPVDGGAESLNKRLIAGYSDNVYASMSNLYLASSEYRYYRSMDPGSVGDDQEQTTVYKFKFDGPKTDFLASAVVPGTILNQFSMDESKGNFRIATTRGRVSREGSSTTNNVYVLDPAMRITGKLEGLAPGESIYSARFMGDRAYLVTFKKTDPFFVLDMADPADPRALGALKVPGYSDYLHPYDADHVIGIGKDTVEAGPEERGDFAWYQGMKVAVFDVTDVANPREMHKVVIGDRGTDSVALSDHKAFLFDRAKNLMVLPVNLAELTEEQKSSPEHKSYDYGDYTFQGAYVYDVSLDGGIRLKGRITHGNKAGEINDGGREGWSSSDITRSLWIGDSLYTVSQSMIKANGLGDLAEQACVPLPGNSE